MKKHYINDKLLTSVILLSLALIFSFANFFSRLDGHLYDVAQKLVARDIPDDVVIIAIDEESLSKLGRWPWDRKYHAKLIDLVSNDGALVIGLDIILAEREMNGSSDQLLSEAIKRAGNVVLPVVIEAVRQNGQLIETLPLVEFSAAAAALGRVHAELDSDAIARSINLWEGLGSPFWPHFAQSILNVSRGDLSPIHAKPLSDSQHGSHDLIKLDRRYINFYTSNYSIPSISYSTVVDGDFSKGYFKNKIVFVGSTAAGMSDGFSTPLSGSGLLMPGIEFLANSYISMRDESLIVEAPKWVSVLISCLVSIVPLLWLPKTSNLKGIFYTLIFSFVLLFVLMMHPILFDVWIPSSAGLLSVFASYPIWAWRRLDSASHFLDGELIRLCQRSASLGFSLNHNHADGNDDPFYKRIRQVQMISRHLEEFDASQKEALAFISHDIRSPLASAAFQIEQQFGLDHPLFINVSRALTWTEDYLQTSRAQLLNVTDFHVFDLIDVLNQVVDEVHPLIQKNRLNFDFNFPDNQVWIHGHADSMHRVIVNILINAIKYSSPNDLITINGFLESNFFHICIGDQGPGIDREQHDILFKKFGRVRRDGFNNNSGVGLGLYFAQTVIQKHGGHIRVDSSPGSTKFYVSVPEFLEGRMN